MRKDATGQLFGRKTKRGIVYGFRFVTLDGQRVQETLGRSWEGCDRREAEARAETLRARVKLGQYRTREERAAEAAAREAEAVVVPTFGQFAGEWLKRRRVLGGRRGNGLSGSGERDLSWRLAHLNGWFGHLRLDEVTEEQVERYAAAKRGAPIRAGGLGATSTNKSLSTLEAIFATAVRYRLVERNPVEGYRVPGARYRAASLETAAQITALLDAAGELDRGRRLREGHGRALLATLVLGGLRLDEALSLRWREVNLARGTLRVVQGKTENAARTIDLLPPLREELATLKARRDGGRDELVFATSSGRKENPTNVRRRLLAPAVKNANARLEKDEEQTIPERLTPHGLRHTFATVRLYLGEEAGYVADQMGHADPGFTYSRYYKRFRRRDGEADRIRALIYGEPVRVEENESPTAPAIDR
jgi:integrase